MDDKIGSVEAGKKADLVLLQNDRSPAMFPILHPYGHVVLQAQRADVDTVVVNGRVVKRGGQLVDVDLARARAAVEATIEHLRSDMGEEAWLAGMQPEIPDTKILDNPYTYTEFRTDSTHAR
jgi:urease alpha subunit